MPGHALDIRDRGAEGVAIERVAMQCPGMKHDLAPFGLGDGGRNRDPAAELVRCTGLALANALNLRGME